MIDLSMDELAAVNAALNRAKRTLHGAIESEPELALQEQHWMLTHVQSALDKVTAEIRLLESDR